MQPRVQCQRHLNMPSKFLKIVIVYSFNEYLLTIYHVPSTVLYAEDINEVKQKPQSQEVSLSEENRHEN